MIYGKSSYNALNVRIKEKCIRGWGVCEILENNMLILPISTHKSYFCDNDAIYDVTMQKPVRKWHHNHRHKISRDSAAE